MRTVALLVMAVWIACLAAARAESTLAVRNTSGHRIQVQIADGTTPQADMWRTLEKGATVKLPFKKGQSLLCQSPYGFTKAPPYAVGNEPKVRVDEMRIYGAPNQPHETMLTVRSDD